MRLIAILMTYPIVDSPLDNLYKGDDIDIGGKKIYVWSNYLGHMTKY